MEVTCLEHRHETALRRFLADHHQAGETDLHGWFADPEWDHATTVEKVNGWSRGEELPDGWEPCTTLFLEEGGELLGVVNLRHTLSEFLRTYGGHIGYTVRPAARRRGVGRRLLRVALEEGGRLGIERFVLTCSPSNVGSRRIIEACGGAFEAEYHHAKMDRAVRRYSITPAGATSGDPV
jgi:predicted acetyltransferase